MLKKMKKQNQNKENITASEIIEKSTRLSGDWLTKGIDGCDKNPSKNKKYGDNNNE